MGGGAQGAGPWEHILGEGEGEGWAQAQDPSRVQVLPLLPSHHMHFKSFSLYFLIVLILYL